METVGFASPGALRCLLIPAECVSLQEFSHYRDILKRVKDVRAVDLTHIPGIFNPQAYPQGYIFYNFVTRDDDADTLFLHDFEPFRKTSQVIGIAKWSQDLTDDKIRSMKDTLTKKYTNPLIHSMLIFDCPCDFSTKIADCYTIQKETTNMETVLCDVTSRFLSKFSTYASAYEHTTLQSPRNITAIPTNHIQLSIEKQRKRLGTFELNQEKAKQMQTKGRKLKLSGNFYLMVGNYKSALSDLCEAIYNLKAVNDYLWLASAFDALSLCLFFLSFIGAPFQLPSFVSIILDKTKDLDLNNLSISSPRPSLQVSASSTPRPSSISIPEVPFGTVKDLIIKIGKICMMYYKLAEKDGGDYLPKVVLIESILRYTSFSLLVESETSLNSNIFRQIIYDNLVVKNSIKVSDNASEQCTAMLRQVMQQNLEDISTTQRLRILSSIMNLYTMLNMHRKCAFIINYYLKTVNESDKSILLDGFSPKQLDSIFKSYALNYGIRLRSDDKLTTPNEIQVMTLNQIIKFCDKIDFNEGFIKYGSIILRDFHTLISKDEQINLYNRMKKKMTFVKTQPSFWDFNIIKNIDFDDCQKFIQNDHCSVYITIKNIFAFDIEISEWSLYTVDELSLTTVKCNIGKESIDKSEIIVIQSQAEIRLEFTVIPTGSGLLKIEGLEASISGCKKMKFNIPEYQYQFFKHKHLSIREEINDSRIIEPIAQHFEIPVVYKQPFLKLIDIQIENHIMLLEGEHRQFKIVLQNMSNVAINQLDVKFHDSTTDPLNTILNRKDIPVNEIYEIEYYLFVKKPFTVLNKFDMTIIEPQETFNLDVRIWGKKGVEDAKLVLEYANQNPENLTDFTRKLEIPVHISVYSSVELAGCDILPLTSNTIVSEVSNDSCWRYLEKVSKWGYQISDFCILALDFMNLSPDEVTITLQSLLKGSDDKDFQEGIGLIENTNEKTFVCTTTLQTRQNIRLFIPILKIDFDEDYLNKNIPSIRKKQFVCDYKTPEAEQRFIKHSFWYRDELLQRLRACWKISENAVSSISAGRSGTIDIRSLKFSSKMLSTIAVEKVSLKLNLQDQSDITVSDTSSVEMGELYSVTVTIKNSYKKPFWGMLRHIVACKNPPYNIEKKVIINGVLQFSIGLPLSPGESRMFTLGVVFLEKGDYEWGVLFDELSGYENGHIEIKRQYLQQEQLKISVA
ncbi:Trs120 protein [Martiniozyma asiatica (nom. inval.)]|nr:Trs120 protein [Martiniozyma asiatica]